MRDAVWLGWRLLVRRPMRVLLLGAGVATAVAVAIGMLSLIASSEERLAVALEELGTRVVVAAAESPGDELPTDSVESMQHIHGVEDVVGFAAVDSVVSHVPPPLASSVQPLPVTDVFSGERGISSVLDLEVRGRDLEPMDSRLDRRVAVLGADAAHQLGLRTEDLLRSSITVDGQPHLIVGLLSPSVGLAAIDTSVFVPRLSRSETGETIVVARTEPRAASDVAEVAGRTLTIDDPAQKLTVRSARALATAERASNDVLRWATIGAAVVAAMVGSISIGSALNTSVRDRRRDIGLQRAFGADRSAIVLAVLVESCGIGCVGCVVGTGIALLTTGVVTRLNGWTMVVDPWLVALVVLVAMLGALLAALLPGVRAAGTDPIESLRTD